MQAFSAPIFIIRVVDPPRLRKRLQNPAVTEVMPVNMNGLLLGNIALFHIPSSIHRARFPTPEFVRRQVSDKCQDD
jgi:hypothetical protein